MKIGYTDHGLEGLIKAMKGPHPKAKVGILANRAPREGSGENNNSSIGLKHEFGDPTENLPMRSFLRQPIIEHFQEFLDKAEIGEETIKEIAEEKTLAPLVNFFGIVGTLVVLEGFDSGGFGKWKPSNMKLKKNHQTLVETQQLRDSISWELKK